MPRKNADGKYIIPAGEIGSYTVCPESWRLSSVEKKLSSKAAATKAGVKMHKNWAKTFEEAADLTLHLRVLLYLVAAAILGFIFIF
ncbi:MAG: hypothetical protein KDD56_00170 [Bdellovibrionales bacterium]|nr:hypothetical protein [Bdellovibrionales bacterium]